MGIARLTTSLVPLYVAGKFVPPPWYKANGATGIIAAYQPKGAASYAASKTNLNNPGTNDATDATHYPTWDATNGWKYDRTQSQYLFANGVYSDAAKTFIIRFTNAATVFDNQRTGAQGASLCPHSWNINVRYQHGDASSLLDVAPALTSGVIGYAGQTAYRNTSSDGTIPSAAVPHTLMYIGAINGGDNNPYFYTTFYLQAWVAYDNILNATTYAAVVTAMAAL